MKRLTSKLSTWTEFNKKLEKNTELVKQFTQDEPQFQIAKSVIKLRLDKKLSQLDLANKIGSKQPAISRLESGTGSSSISFLHKIAQATNTKLVVCFEH